MPQRSRIPAGAWAILLNAALSAGIAPAQSGVLSPDHPAIGYMVRPLQDPVAVLSRKIQSGKLQLRFEGEQGYLRSILEALDIPIESQMAVFSKTSVQPLRIDPKNPRALYFNDSVAVSFVRHGSMEVAALDPQQGMIFYTVDQREWVYKQRMANPAAAAIPPFQRRTDCLTCHISPSTHGIPGTLVRSVFPGLDGMPLQQYGVTDTDQRTPFKKLWGGWYVTGDSGSARHMGNGIVTNDAKPESMLANQAVNLESLKEKFDTSAYLSPYSDIVALMVFEHQMHMMNLLVEAGWKTRISPRPDVIQQVARDLVDFLLFVDEPALTDKVRGSSGFDRKFASQGPRDHQGRSLRQLDLDHRLMRYPCSYMIYSQAFEELPSEAKDAIYHRLWQILSGQETGEKYERLSPADRIAILQILHDTKSDLPAYFRTS